MRDNKLPYARHPGQKADPDKLPRHIAVVMDGNGRWAQLRGLSRLQGHRKGVEAARTMILDCQKKGIEVLTLFAFGTENWKRPRHEIRNLFRIFFLVLRKDLDTLQAHNIKLRVIGDRTGFTSALLKAITHAEQRTISNTGLVLNIAMNYSGRWDLLNAMTQALAQSPLDSQTAEVLLNQKLALAGLPEPDLFIRTGGVQRISNFMLWELAYTELYFTKILWPDFKETDFDEALIDYSGRERRFGLTGDQLL